MSLETLFEVLPSCLLALPTDFTSDCTSTSGSFTPRTFRCRLRLLSRRPPATPAAAAPAATAGPPALLAAPLSVSTTLPFERAALRPLPFDRDALLDALLRLLRAALLRLPPEALPPDDRDALPRLDRAALRPVARFFERAPFAEFVLLFPLRELAFVAMPSLSSEDFFERRVPPLYTQ
jgi:hypothetical protein